MKQGPNDLSGFNDPPESGLRRPGNLIIKKDK